MGSHVMQYGDIGISKGDLFSYMGTNPANDNYTFVDENSLRSYPSKATNQRDADLVHFWDKVCTPSAYTSLNDCLLFHEVIQSLI